MSVLSKTVSAFHPDDSSPAFGNLSPASDREIDLSRLLDRTQQMLTDHHSGAPRVAQAIESLFLGLHRLRSECDEGDWRICLEQCHTHPVSDMIHEDPFTRRAFTKPRGYAGDAELLDLIYGPEEGWPEPQASPLGREIYKYTSQAPAAEGVRARRAFIADLIDRSTAENPKMHILAIAAGHLREATLAAAIRRRRIGRFVALDADPVSLDEVTRCYGTYGVETIAASIRPLLTNKLKPGQFDLIYSTGLFDYLSEETGRRLVTVLFNMLRPGGQLVVANFLPGIRDVGYMEAFMDWKLIYRTRREMIDLTMEIPEADLRDVTLFAEDNRNIIFVQVTKR